jgi:hypothetical protein
LWLPLLAGLAYYGLVVVRSAVAERSAVHAVLVAWLVGLACLYAVFGVWFPRQAYLAVVPLALLLGDVLALTLAGGDPPIKKALHLVPQLTVLVVLASASPVFTGDCPSLSDRWVATDQMFDVIDASLPELKQPAELLLVLPYNAKQSRKSDDGLKRSRKAKAPKLSRNVKQPLKWAETLAKGYPVRVVDYVYYDSRDGYPMLTVRDGESALQLPEGASYLLSHEDHDAEASRFVKLGQKKRRNTYIYLPSATGGEVVALAKSR